MNTPHFHEDFGSLVETKQKAIKALSWRNTQYLYRNKKENQMSSL